jgi:DNA-binding transcriptional MocR family regulator
MPARDTAAPPPADSPFASTPATPPALARGSDVTLAEQLAGHFAQRIRTRLIAPGARLPSVRECARRHGVSPHTVVAAYDQLLARGLVEARRQRGFYVREHEAAAARAAPAAEAAAPPPGPRVAPVDATALIRGMFHHDGGKPAPGLGTLPPQWLDLPLLASALRRAATHPDGGIAVQYGDPGGDPRLRQALATRLADLGVRAAPAQIVTTAGATHALTLIARTLLQPGDAVLVDEPGWAVEYARLTQLGMRLLPVPRGADGPDLAVMHALAAAHRPRLYCTVSVLHNPTGTSLSLAAAHQLLMLAKEHDLRIVEDDTYAWIAPPQAPRLAALDGLQRTIYVSGFSKILTPSWRVGYFAAPPDLVDRIVDTKLLTGLTTPTVLERAVAICLEQGQLHRHAERVSARLAEARARSAQLVREAGCRFATPPAGLFGWVDTGVDTERLAQGMLDDGWLLAPGRLFHVERRPSTLMRINFAATQEAKFWRAFSEARDAL